MFWGGVIVFAIASVWFFNADPNSPATVKSMLYGATLVIGVVLMVGDAIRCAICNAIHA